jgi:DNA repair exonuclease SbcCD ATPase subunit
VAHPLVETARELERRDAELAAQIAGLVELEQAIAALRVDAERFARFREELPGLRERASTDLRAAEEEVARRETTLADARAALARAKDEHHVEAERVVVTAATALLDAESRAARAVAEIRRLEQEADAAERRTVEIEQQARELASRAGVAFEGDVERWGGEARAAVFGRRTHAESERQRLQEEASELGSSVTGEPLVGDVALVRRRVESALGT